MLIKRVVIVGAGAVGGSIGGLLARNQAEVVLIARGDHGRALQESGLTVHRPHESFSIKPECFTDLQAFAWQEGDIAVVATKLNDAEAALDNLLAAATKLLPVVCATNGIHAEKWACDRFEHVVSMMVWMPATHLIPGEVLVYGGKCPGALDCGPIQKNKTTSQLSIEFCDLLKSAGFDSKHRSDILAWKHAKWITNLANTAQALVDDDWKAVARAAQSEGMAVLDAAKLPFVSRDKLKTRVACVELLPIGGQERLGGSTWQSLHLGKPLESPWLEGAIVELAQRLGVSTPINQALSDAGRNRRRLSSNEVLSLRKPDS